MHEWTAAETVTICSIIAMVLITPIIAVLAQIRDELKKMNKSKE